MVREQVFMNIGNRLLKKYSLDNWILCFNDAKRFYGYCHYHKNKISISRELFELNNLARSFRTLKHEIAHALTKSGHDKLFFSKCAELGIPQKRCYDSKDTIIPNTKWLGTCVKCGITWKRHRRTIGGTHCSKRVKWTRL